MPKRPKASNMQHGEGKEGRVFVITPSLSEMIDARSESLGLSRSEYVERGIRWLDAHWDGQLQKEIGGNGD